MVNASSNPCCDAQSSSIPYVHHTHTDTTDSEIVYQNKINYITAKYMIAHGT